MKLITRDTDYALRALCFIAKEPKKMIAARKLFSELGIPYPFLRKIMQVLKHHGIVSSCKGQGGGFSLLVPTSRLYLKDIIRIFQGEFSLNECLFKKKICPGVSSCMLRRHILSWEKQLKENIESVSIESLLSETGGSFEEKKNN